MDFNPSNLPLDFEKGFTLPFDLKTGMSAAVDTGKRHLTDMKGMFADAAAEAKAIEDGNPLIYEFHSLPAPNHGGDLAFGCSIVYPGKVGDEYYMTKGHFHTILETGEVYYCLSGHGYMMMENPEGDWRLVTFFVFRADAGHNYGTIEEKGYRKLLVERDGKPAIIDNPKWNS